MEKVNYLKLHFGTEKVHFEWYLRLLEALETDLITNKFYTQSYRTFIKYTIVNNDWILNVLFTCTKDEFSNDFNIINIDFGWELVDEHFDQNATWTITTAVNHKDINHVWTWKQEA